MHNLYTLRSKCKSKQEFLVYKLLSSSTIIGNFVYFFINDQESLLNRGQSINLKLFFAVLLCLFPFFKTWKKCFMLKMRNLMFERRHKHGQFLILDSKNKINNFVFNESSSNVWQ